ncbi:D-ribose transporter subunit; membrane component of ABC superfamily [Acetoanaerobium sticklandii]|uniref:D-ribose transporter subunit membrane component of ABC superfamily n=1 Tax=Acetoanaerobium sticklandii (strain ATCC 12662 / DSM 519 / JCM 1433 / CCUG 9281 / NCIMB 10654 / HF) TaxID=499177 RepID=E3PV74_ACESD|nr:ribose ABC transporter permease [Acetoanaerobium sticklandii]CBH22527.1 D-ribose transporter subunit; membrane component of ABC superfamily [Acetoanaerobium sticklandii]
MKKIDISKFQSLIGLIVFSVIVAFINSRFMTTSNILNILRQTSINAVIATGMTFVILTGGIDLSVGSILGFSGAVAAMMLASGVDSLIAIPTALVVGLIAGGLNGVLISKGKLQPFIVTLATMTMLRGATLVFTDGKPIGTGFEANSKLFAWFGNGYVLGIPVPIIVIIVTFLVALFVLTQTKIGRYVYALGGNEEATKLSGISTDKVKIFVYAISGMMAALAGIIITSRLSSAQPTAGSGYELDAIAAVVLGGTSLAGGTGTIVGTMIGALIIGVLNNALNLMDVSSYFQMLAKGSVILLAVLLDRKNK